MDRPKLTRRAAPSKAPDLHQHGGTEGKLHLRRAAADVPSLDTGFTRLDGDGDGVGQESRTRLVWLVEPDVAVQGKVSTFLRSQDWSYETFDQAEQALERLREGAPLLDAILLTAADRSGAEHWVQRALTAGARAPVIVLGPTSAFPRGVDPVESHTFAAVVDPVADLEGLGRTLQRLLSASDGQPAEPAEFAHGLSPSDGGPLDDHGLLGSSP